MSGDGKRSDAEWPKLPRPSSTLPQPTCADPSDECPLSGVKRTSRGLVALSAFVKVFGCRLMTDGAANSAVGGRRSKTSKGGNRGNGYVRRFRGLYGDLAASRGAADGSRWD